MKKMKIKNLIVWGFIFAVIGQTACTKNDDETLPPDNATGYSLGVFIINEGPFQSGTGTITYLNRDGSGVEEEIYQAANNGVPLGNIVQSMNQDTDGKKETYIAINNANKIEVVDIKTFKRVHTIENIASPRYIEFGGNGKVYISSWDNTVKVFSTEGYEFFGQVNVGTGPEKMLRVDNTIWVLNQGGFAVDSTISIISSETDEVVHTLQVYAKPTGIQLDENGLVWVMCSGNGWNGFPGIDDTEAHLLCIDPTGFNFVKDIAFPTSSEHPEKLVINKEGNLLFYNFIDGIYQFDIHGSELEEVPFISRNNMFYSLGLDRGSNIIYAGDPIDFVQHGLVYRYDVYTGNVLDSLQAGIVPGEFFFTQ